MQGSTLAIERQIAQHTLGMLAPTSGSSSNYCESLPSRPRVFSQHVPNNRMLSLCAKAQWLLRATVHTNRRHAADAFVFISATKFSSNENPGEPIETCARIASAMVNVHRLALAVGTMFLEVKRACTQRCINPFKFLDFMVSCELWDCFLAGDAYLHFYARVGVFMTPRVGLARGFIEGGLQRFPGAFRDWTLIADRLRKPASRTACALSIARVGGLTGYSSIDASTRRCLSAVT